MPLAKIGYEEARENRKSNHFSTWGSRSKANRVEPITRPSFETAFKMVPGETIFTIGSCFARNVELELERKGYDIPLLKLMRSPKFAKYPPELINNFGTPSIYNELYWSLFPESFNEDDNFIKIGQKYSNMHFDFAMRPEPLDELRETVACFREAYRYAFSSRVVIITLGLAEVWYDTKTELYLNRIISPAVSARFPGRFELHVLTYDEAYSYLARSLELIRDHGRPDVRVILTVSPVPIQTTQRPIDVIVANSYSKAVLRSAAEAAVMNYDFVTYYPSFESVSMTDRKIAWLDDLVHVSQQIVRINVGRMINAYTDQENEIASDADALDHAEEMAERRDEAATDFFLTFAHLGDSSPGFAFAHARHLDSNPRFALREMARIPDSDKTLTMSLFEARMLSAAGEHDKAVMVLRPLLDQSDEAWLALIHAYVASRQKREARNAMRQWLARPGYARRRVITVAQAWEQANDHREARLYYELALTLFPAEESYRAIFARFCKKRHLPDAVAQSAGLGNSTPAERRMIVLEALRRPAAA